MVMEKKGVEWIETILYTLISLAVIGTLLAVVQPKIAQLKDSIIIDQTKSSLNEIDRTIQNTKAAAGMTLFSELNLGKGTLLIDAPNDSITWEYLSKYQYGELNKTLNEGNLKITTTKVVAEYKITIKLSYDIDLTFNGIDSGKTLQAASIPYKLWFKNKGGYIDITLG